MTIYSGSSGRSYTLGTKIGSGGEGDVYEIPGDNTRVAKLYKKQKFKDKNDRLTMDRKLNVMIKMNIPVVVDGKLRLAWPLDILYENGSMVGFVMPKINFKRKIIDIERVDEVKKIYPQYTWKYSVQYAYNLAWVVKYVHEHNIVIGDFNFNNFYADTSSGAVVLIDCDSFDIKDPVTGEHFACKVALPELLAPELQNAGNLKNATFTKEADDFSLAIHLFRLLMRNEDPFGGIRTSRKSISVIKANRDVINGECPYVKNVKDKVIPKRAPSLSVLTPKLQELFQRTFNYDAVTCQSRIKRRATAQEWCDALIRLGAPEPNRNLVICSVNSHHVYPKHNTSCPWCKCESHKTFLPVTPVPLIKKSVHQNIPTSNVSSGQGSTVSGVINNTRAAATSGGTNARRAPYLFYGVLIAFGLASGFVFGKTVSDGVYSSFGLFITPKTCALLLSIVGVLAGALGAYYFEERYVYANNSIPWLFGGFAVLITPFLIAVVLRILAWITIIVVGGVIAGFLALISVIVGIALAVFLFIFAIWIFSAAIKFMLKSIF